MTGDSPDCELPRPDIAIRENPRDLWLQANRAALEAYNEQVESDGVFSDGMRSF